MKTKYKNLFDIDFIMEFKNKSGNVQVPLRNMHGTDAIKIFKEAHFMHLININHTKGVIPFNIDFKTFLSEEIGISIRKIEYMAKTLISNDYIIKEGKIYTLTKKYTSMFKKERLPLSELPWKDQPNYK